MKKRVNEFFFGIYSCLGGRTIIGIFVYLLFLVLYFEKSFLMMCEYYQYTPDNLNSFIEYVFFNGFPYCCTGCCLENVSVFLW